MSGRRNGFVLVAALWLLVAIGAVALAASIQSQTRRTAAANALDRGRARAAANAGAEYARSRLTAALLDHIDELRADAGRRSRGRRGRGLRRLLRRADPAEDPWRAPQELAVPDRAFGDARFEVRMRDVGAALNLNEADEEQLQRFFALGLDVDYAEAERLAQTIADWRDPDEIARVNGAEREQYIREGASVLPTNGPFARIDDLRHVLGMPPAVYEAARPYLTLRGSGRININAAPEPVLVSLPGIDEALAAELVRMRDGGQPLPRSRDELERLVPAGVREIVDDSRRFRRLTTFSTDEVEILVEGWVEGSPVRSRQTMIVARSETGAVVVWRDGG